MPTQKNVFMWQVQSLLVSLLRNADAMISIKFKSLHSLMIHAKGSRIFNTLLYKLRGFLSKETTLSPFLYFLLFAYFHYPQETPLWLFPYLLFLFAVAVAVTAKFNFLYTLVPWTQSGALIAVPMLAIGLLSSTNKWKMYLLLLAIGDSFFTSTSQHYFLVIFSFLICCEIHRNFIFRTLSQNIQYFTGFVGICIYYALIILQDYFQTTFRQLIYFILVLAGASLAHAFIKHQATKLVRADPRYIYSGRLMAHYLRAMGETANDIPLLRTQISSHSRACRESNCFCHSKDHGEKAEYLMRQLYENALERFKGETDSLLLENYVQFLLKNGQAINALHFLSEWQPQGYFSVLGHQRARAKVERQIREANSSNLYELQYEYALEYDQHYQRVAVEINSILKLKLQFWREVSKETPRVSRMQALGDEIIARMHDLNVFYSKVVQLERSLYLFDATALYAMYMLSTTNFKEYSELIIKNTAKLLEEVYLLDSGSSQTFAIRTVVRRRDNSFMQNSEEGLKPMKHATTQHSFMHLHENGCKLIIDAVSEGLCKIVGVRRMDLLGQELNSIIPEGYKEVHNVRLSYLLDFQSESLKEIVPSKVMHKELKLPMKCHNNGLAMAYVCIKFLVDPKEGLTFISVVKLARDRSSYVLMDFEGRITQSEDGFNKEILRHSQIQRYLQRLRQTWQEEKVVPEERFNLMINTANYCITISSPLLGLFLQKQNLKQKCPPIHLQITNQESTRNRTLEAGRHNKVGMQIQQMQHAINAYDAQSSTSTTRSGSSAVNVINTFSESGSHPLYRLLQLAFLATILICVLSNLAAFFVTSLPWDPSVPTRNPLNDTMNLYALQMLTIKAALIIGQQQSYMEPSNIFNRTRVSQYFGNKSFQTNMAAVTHDMETAFKDSIRNILGTPSKLLQPYINQRLKTLLAISDPPSMAINGRSLGSQNISYLDLLMIYASDLNLMARFNLVAPTLRYSFTIPVAQTQNCSFLSPIIDEAVEDSQSLATAVHIGLMLVIVLLVLPSFILLRRRLSLHEKVFDLLASIDGEQVASEINSLEHVANILRNSRESSEIMKMNVVGYQQNVLHHSNQRRNSSDNEMVLGLEKYDVSQQNYELALQKYESKTPPSVAHLSSHRKLKVASSTGSLRVGSIKQATLLGIVKESYLSTQAEQSQNRRKRSGELELGGSELDPARKIIGEHCLLYLIFLSFLVILGMSIQFKLDFDGQYLKGKDELLATYTDQIRFEIELVSIKIVYGYGLRVYAYFFGLSDPLPTLVSLTNRTPKYSYDDGMNIYAEIFQNCSTSPPPIPATFVAKYCQYDYSQVLLKGQYGSLFSQLIEYRYLLDTGTVPSGMDRTAILQNITEKVYYMQSLNIRLQQLVLMKVNLLFAGLVELGKAYALKQGLMLVASGIWGVICFVVGWGIIVRMKKSYFRQVFMITFLNSEMILKNKRVESFLDALAKNAAT